MMLEDLHDILIDMGYEKVSFVEFNRTYESMTFKKNDELVKFSYGENNEIKVERCGAMPYASNNQDLVEDFEEFDDSQNYSA